MRASPLECDGDCLLLASDIKAIFLNSDRVSLQVSDRGELLRKKSVKACSELSKNKALVTETGRR